MSELLFYDIETFPTLFTCTAKRKSDGEVFQWSWHEDEGFKDLHEMFKHFSKQNWLVGYNNIHFDDRVIQWMIDEKPKQPREIYEFAQTCIQDETNEYSWGKGVRFNTVDLMRVGYLDKSLKMVAVNLEWPLIQDLPYKHDTHVEKRKVPKVLSYNLNDVEITERLYEELERDIKLRKHLTKKYGQNLMTDSNSGIANKLLNKMYEEASGKDYWDFKDDRTYRDEINLGSLISEKLTWDKPFKRRNLVDLVEEMHNTTLESDEMSNFGKFEYEVRVGDTNYQIAKGGIHSENSYELYESTDEYTYVELDFSSYYPFLMIQLGIYPEHLDEEFLNLFEDIVNERLKYKRADKYVESDALKIVINAVYGKLGSQRYWLYDPKAMYSVTINGQLFMLKMIEIMEDNGFPCVYANTDGAFFKVDRSRYEKFKQLYEEFEDFTGFVLDDEEFTQMLLRDVNNYILEKADGDRKRAGDLDKDGHKGSWGIMRSYDKPIVAEAIEKYFFDEVPVEKTVKDYEGLMRFCMAQKAGKKFDVMKRTIENGQLKEEQIQRTNRYFVSEVGDSIFKRSENKEISLAGTAEEHVLIYNEKGQHDRDKVKDQYYIKEAKKITTKFDYQQTSLF